MTRAVSSMASGYLTGSGLVADLGPLLPSQGCRVPSPDRGMKYDARTSSPTRKTRRDRALKILEEARMWNQLIFPARERPVYGPPHSPAGWGDRGPGKVLFDDLTDIEPEPDIEPVLEDHGRDVFTPALEVATPEPGPAPGSAPAPAPEPEPEPKPEPEVRVFDFSTLDPEVAAAAQFLREVPSFAMLADTAMVAVASKLQLLVFEESQTICKKGDRGGALYMVVTGQCGVEHGSFSHDDAAGVGAGTFRPMQAHDCFGHASLIAESDRCSADIIASSTRGCTCYALPKGALSGPFNMRLLFPQLQVDIPMLFKEADEDRSGGLDPAEVRTLINTLGFADFPDQYIAGIWDVFDADGDGVLDLEEVKELVEVLAEEHLKELSILGGPEVGDVWHSDTVKRAQREEVKHAKTPKTPQSRPASTPDGRPGSSDLSGAEMDGQEPQSPVDLAPYTGARAAEMERIRTAFLHADDDHSGALDKIEVRSLIKELGYNHVTDNYLEGVWGIFDVDGDGVLDLEEVQEMMEVLGEENGAGMGGSDDSDDY